VDGSNAHPPPQDWMQLSALCMHHATLHMGKI